MTASDDLDTVRNEATGEEVRFILTGTQTGGEMLVMEDRWTRAGHVVPPHAHPGIEERWTILAGRVVYRIGDDEIVAGPGDTVAADAGVMHSARDAGDGEVLVRIEMRPALRWEEFVRQLFVIASESLDDQSAERSFNELFSEFAPEIKLQGHA